MEKAEIRIIQGKEREYYEVSLGERACAFVDEEHAQVYALLLEVLDRLDKLYKCPCSVTCHAGTIPLQQ